MTAESLARLSGAERGRLLASFDDERHGLGQYFTPPRLAALTCALAIRAPGARVLEPSAGTGVFARHAWERLLALGGGGAAPGARVDALELDPILASLTRAACPQAEVTTGSFFASLDERVGRYDAVVGNPPYTRLQELGRIDGTGVEALAARLSRLFEGVRLSRRASAYVHFLLAGVACLAPGGRLALITPNAWLDVSSARAVREVASGPHARLVAVVQPARELWFGDASVNAVVTVLERRREGEREGEPARFVSLERPLAELGDPAALAEAILDPGGAAPAAGLVARSVPREELAAAPAWGRGLREPPAVRELTREGDFAATLVALGELADCARGFTTGANGFFYLPPETALERRALAPLLKSPRDLRAYEVDAGDCRWRVLRAPAGKLPPRVAAHVAEGERLGLGARANCAARKPWYRLGPQTSPAMVMAKGVWERWVVARVVGKLCYDQQLYGLTPRADLDEAHRLALWAILNSAWTLTQAELTGRTNFGEGVLWLAAYEVAAFHVPDPRRFSAAALAALSAAMAAVAEHPVAPRAEALARPEQLHLERTLLEATGVPAERSGALAGSILEAAIQLGEGRRSRAARR